MKQKTINDEHGCSTCAAGKENYTTFRMSGFLGKKYGEMYQYDYRTPDGELFSCVAKTLEECRTRRDNWLKKRLTLTPVVLNDYGGAIVQPKQIDYGKVFKKIMPFDS